MCNGTVYHWLTDVDECFIRRRNPSMMDRALMMLSIFSLFFVFSFFYPHGFSSYFSFSFFSWPVVAKSFISDRLPDWRFVENTRK